MYNEQLTRLPRPFCQKSRSTYNWSCVTGFTPPTKKNSEKLKKKLMTLTIPRFSGVSSKDIMTNFDDGYSWFLVVTIPVECTR